MDSVVSTQLHNNVIKISTESEFLKFAFSKYDNPHLVSICEFENDLKRFKSINLLLNRYREDSSNCNHRLIINHLIVLSNCFSQQGVLEMIKYKIQDENLPILDTFLYYLNFIEKTQHKIDFYLLDKLNE